MKKLFGVLILLCAIGTTQAQNLQFLYGYGNGQAVNTITLEIFKPLDHGVFYYYNDFKIDLDGYFESYTEISKYWNIGKNGLSVTAQYNVGYMRHS